LDTEYSLPSIYSLGFFSVPWIQPLLMTLQLMVVSVTIAAVIGVVGAWAASSLEGGGRWGRIISRGFLASMLVGIATPMILHAAAWEATAGKFGWMIMTQTGSRADGSAPYGFFAGLLACGWIHGLVGGAFVALATWHGVRRVESEVIQQSRLELGPIATWWRVRLPIAIPWLIIALLATAVLAATEMTVVDLYGYRSIADEFYLIYAIDPSFASVLMTCCLPLATVSLLLVWLFLSRPRLLTIQQDSDGTLALDDPLPRGWQWFAQIIAIAVACLVVVVPVGGLIVKLGHQVVVENDLVRASWSIHAFVDRLFDAPKVFAEEYQWTAMIAIISGMTAVSIAWPIAAAGRTHRRIQFWVDLFSILLVTIPGPIVGLAVVSLFQTHLPGFRTLYQQTLIPTLIAVLDRATTDAYWILRAGYRGIDDSVLDASRLDSSPLKRIWSIDRPLLKTSIVAAFLAAAVVASGDVPAMLPVMPPGVTTVGTRLFGLLHSGARYQEASLAIWYVAVVAMICLIWLRQGAVLLVKVK
jgi:iron(III) transport system permease protein